MTGLPDVLVAPVWLISTSLTAWAGWSLGGRLFPSDWWLQRVCHAVVIGWALVVVVGITLGAAGWLTGGPLLAGVTGASVATILLAYRRPTSPPSRAMGQPQAVARGWGAVWGIVFAFWVGHVVVDGLFAFPAEWDALMYHLPLVDQWLQAGSLYTPDNLFWGNPGNSELVVVWLVAPFTGDFLHALSNLPATCLLAGGSVDLGRRLGAGSAISHLAALAVVTNVVVLIQLVSPGNDVAAAALFVAGLSYAFRYVSEDRAGSLVLAVCCLGLLVGVKYYALGYGAAGAVAGVVAIGRERGGRAAMRAVGIGVVAVAALGGYWYGRNWVAGNGVLHPFGGPRVDVSGYPGGLWQSTILANGSSDLAARLVEAVWGMAGPCTAAGLLALPMTLCWLLSPAPSRIEKTIKMSFALVTVSAGLVWVVTPFAAEDDPGTLNQIRGQYCPVRYGLCFLSLAVIGLGATLDHASGLLGRVAAPPGRPPPLGTDSGDRRRPGRATVCLGPGLFAAALGVQVVVSGATGWLSPFDAGLVGWTVFASVVLIGTLRTARRWVRNVVGVLLAAGGLAAATAGVGWLSLRWHSGYAPYYDLLLGDGMFLHLSREVPSGTRFCVMEPRPYPFFGSARQFHVLQTAEIQTYPEWVAHLRVRRTRVVAVRYDTLQPWQEWHNYRAWFEQHTGVFRRIDQGEWRYAVYQLEQDGLVSDTTIP